MKKGYPFRTANQMVNLASYPLSSDILNQLECSSLKLMPKKDSSIIWVCSVNSKNPKFLFLGDSHTDVLTLGLAINNIDILAIRGGSTLPFLSNPEFKKLLNNALETYHNIEYVGLNTRSHSYLAGLFGDELQNFNKKSNVQQKINSMANVDYNKKLFVEGYIETINYLHSQGKKVIFTIDHPELGFDPKTCGQRAINISSKKNINCTNDRKIIDTRNKEYYELIAKIKEKIPSLIIYDPKSIFYDEQFCYGKRNNIIYYYDNNHLNIEGAKVLGNHFKEWFLQYQSDLNP